MSLYNLKLTFLLKYPDKKVPILDIKVWFDSEGKVMHEYYCKPMASKCVIDYQSTMPFKDRQMDSTHPRPIKNIIMMQLWATMEWEKETRRVFCATRQCSAYEETVRKEIVRCAIKTYESINKKFAEKERPITE